MLIDSHCHLDSFSDVPDVLARAQAAGVERIVTIGTNRAEFKKVYELIEAHQCVWGSIGVHPHEAEKEDGAIKAYEIAKLAAHPKIIGIGEAGLDYFYHNASREAQVRTFREHIRAAIALRMPLVIHTRQAEDDTMAILDEERKGHETELTGVFHCYSSNEKLAAFGLEIGFYFSFSGMITFQKSENVRRVARMVPEDKILVETDAPFLAPEPFRGKKCEPAHVVYTARKVAELKRTNEETFAAKTTQNFYRLFKKAKGP